MVASNGTENGSAPVRGVADIPGPLGIESASLKGKVALVTGSGK
jgi:tetrahydroxynaphthalene reductase